MQICIFDAKVRQDQLTTKWLGSALANIYFYHGTVVKVYILIIVMLKKKKKCVKEINKNK